MKLLVVFLLNLSLVYAMNFMGSLVQLPQCRFNDTQLNVCLKDRAEKILTFPSVNPLILNSPLFNLPLQKMLGDKLKFEELEIKRLRRMKVENVQIVIEKPELIYQIRYLAAGLTVSGISGYEFCKGEFSVFLQNLEADVKIVGSLKTEGQHEYLTLHTATNAHSLKSLQFNSFKDKCNSLSAAFFEGLRKFQVFAADKCYSTKDILEMGSIEGWKYFHRKYKSEISEVAQSFTLTALNSIVPKLPFKFFLP